jgi:hypothetical protein
VIEHRQHVTHGSSKYPLRVGDWFVLIDDVRIQSARGASENRWRIATSDVSTGQLVADRKVPADTKCWQATETRVGSFALPN